jgi:hypothetical protein
VSAREWEALRAEHRHNMEAFVSSAGALLPADWLRKPSPDKWSPAQIARHLVLTYDVVLRDLEGGVGFRLRLTWWRRLSIRLRYLGAVLNEGRFPPGSPAVREVRPGDETRPQAALIAEFRERADRFEAEISRVAASGRTFAHPFFGRLKPAQGLRLISAHIEHHRRQLLPRDV